MAGHDISHHIGVLLPQRSASLTAATATGRSTRSSSCAATRRCCRSTPEPTRSRSRRSRAICSRTETPEKSAAAHVAPGVFTLGEIGYMNEEGYVFITDRFSDMILSGGVNIYPAEAEQVLIEHEAVADVACIGVPHPEMGEELKALIIPEHPETLPDAAELLNWVRDRLSHFKCPRSVDFVDSIGRNTMGKVNKRKLRAPYWEGHAT